MNVAGGANSGVLSGQINEACDQLSVIGGGDTNTIYGNGGIAAEESFIGAGANNYISSYHSGIGAGVANTVSGTNAFLASGNTNDIEANHAFIGSGDYGEITGSGSVIGAGDYEYFLVHGSLPFGNQVAGTDSFVGTGDLNSVSGSGSFIGAGGYFLAADGASTVGNQVVGDDAFIGSGDQNNADSDQTFLGGGQSNSIGDAARFAALAGGDENTINAPGGFIGSGAINTVNSAASDASILGGMRNSASGQYASVLGGFGNNASGAYAIVAGGDGDLAAGTLSFAGGYHADATHNGSFVWGDYTSGATLKDSGINQFVARASGGIFLYSNKGATSGVELAPGSGSWSSLSDRDAKTDIVPLDDASILAKVSALPIDGWRYTSESGVRHVGPMAQDFYAAFGVGADDRHITSIDEDGVALAAIKALHRENDRLRNDVTSLRAAQRLDARSRDHEIAELHAELRRLEAGSSRGSKS